MQPAIRESLQFKIENPAIRAVAKGSPLVMAEGGPSDRFVRELPGEILFCALVNDFAGVDQRGLSVSENQTVEIKNSAPSWPE